MSKDRTSLSLDPDVAEYLRQDHVNASGLVNRLVGKHMDGGASEDIIREFRIQQVKSELSELQSQAERKQNELEKLHEIDENQRSQRQSQIEDARDVLADVPHDPSNPAIEKWATELGMTPQELIDELEEASE